MILCMKNDHVVRSVPQPCCISVQAFPRGRSKEHLKQFYYNSKFGDFSIFNTRWAHVLYNLLECKKKHVYMSLRYVPSGNLNVFGQEGILSNWHNHWKVQRKHNCKPLSHHEIRDLAVLAMIRNSAKILSDFGASLFFLGHGRFRNHCILTNNLNVVTAWGWPPKPRVLTQTFDHVWEVLFLNSEIYHKKMELFSIPNLN